MNLKHKLEYHYKYFDRSQISPDPLEFLHLYSYEKDIEIAGFLSAIFAYGNVNLIVNILHKIHNLIENKPYQFIKNYNHQKDKSLFKNIKYRFYTSQDISNLFSILNLIYKNYGSLKNFFFKNYDMNDINIKNSLKKFSNEFLNIAELEKFNITRGLKFMLPDPDSGSACKRSNLFLRWMIRNDELDFGLWKEIPTHKLIIPVDTHIAKISKELGLTNLQNVSWKMAEEITENLKKYDPFDPVKYDFAICHIGMRKMKF